MPHLVFTAGATRGLSRCLRFLSQRDKHSAGRAAQTIDLHFAILRANPMIGRISRQHGSRRELIIPFGDRGYVALYHFDAAEDCIRILAFRHQREAGY